MGFEAEPSGLATLMVAVPGEATSSAGTLAVSNFALRKVVASGLPFQSAAAFCTNPAPAIVSRSAALPAATELGSIRVILSEPLTTLKVAGAEIAAGVLRTEILMAPRDSRSDDGTVASASALETTVVASGAAFHSITEAGTK